MLVANKRNASTALGDQLARARQDLDPVRIHRPIEDADVLDGYVLATGSKWTLLASIGNGFELDGWLFFRNRHVERVQRHLRRDYPTRLLKARRQWPPAGLSAGPSLGRTEAMLRDVSTRFPVMSVYEEERDPQGFSLGTPVEWTRDAVWLTELSTTAEWDDCLVESRFRDVSRVDVGDRYAANLLEVAGSPPERTHSD